MGDDGLFDDLPEQAVPRARCGVSGRPRLREPMRDQIELRAVDLDDLIGLDHPARLVWTYVERLDLSALEHRIKAREGRPGHPPTSPRLMLALWLYATSEGVGSARALAALCVSHDAYRWLRGGVSVNYHTLGDFRLAHPALLEGLLIENVAALAAAGVIDLDGLAQDGIKVRAGAGAASFRRRKTLTRHRRQARRLVERLAAEVDDDPSASNRRIKAARERAARERLARVEQALAKLDKIEAERGRREQTNATRKVAEQSPSTPDDKPEKAEPRVSTTDPQARIIKMADGGFRPAYNMQIASAVESQIVVAVDITANSSERGLLRPMLEQIERIYDTLPRTYLADGGFTKNDDTEWAADNGVLLHCPPIKNKHNTDPLAPRAGDKPGVAAWRRRMRSPAGKARYKRRPIAECIHARFRQWNLHQLTVRGSLKARAVLLWFALTNNLFQAHRLTQGAAA